MKEYEMVPITPALLDLCGQILEMKWSEKEWAENESDDWFASDIFVGGFDADEKAFCFSYFRHNKPELWFQFTLNDARRVIDGKIEYFRARMAE